MHALVGLSNLTQKPRFWGFVNIYLESFPKIPVFKQYQHKENRKRAEIHENSSVNKPWIDLAVKDVRSPHWYFTAARC